MRKLRSRLTILTMTVTVVSSFISIAFAVLTINGRIFDRDEMHLFMFGLALRDIILVVFAVAVIILGLLMVSHSTTNPILDLNKAIKKVADGDYSVQLNLKDRVEEFGELQKNFNTMVTQLKSSEYLHKDFASNISHELKTPLAIISGYAKLLEDSSISDEERKLYVHMICEESQRLTSLTSNLLRLSSMDYSEIHAKNSTFRLDEQLRQAVLSLEPKWNEKSLNMLLDLQDTVFHGDEELLFQAWSNLLDNAIKFSDDEGSISVKLFQHDNDVVIKITDSGIGMSEETIEHMFDQFYRGNTDKRYSGSGLGLSLVHRIIKMHNGSITAESELKKGTEFTISLPSKRC